MIVPDADEGGAGMGRLQRRIALILRMTRAIIGQGDDLVRGLRGAADRLPDLRAVAVGAIFIDIVAQMDDGVDPLQRGDRIIGGEEAAGIKLARHDRHYRVRRLAFGQRAEPAGG